MASGFLNMLSYWFFAISSVIMLASLFVEGGAASGGSSATPNAADAVQEGVKALKGLFGF